MIECEVNGKGIICPWCPGKRPMKDCIHNPFKLMAEIETLKKKIDKNRRAASVLDNLREYLDYFAAK